MKFVIVEDDPDAMDVIVEILKNNFLSDSSHSDIKEFPNPALFMAFNLKEHKPELAILDLMMPKISGFEICRYIKENSPQTKVLAITGYDNPQNREKIFKSGADDLVTKPFDLDFFVKKIRSLLSEPK